MFGRKSPQALFAPIPLTCGAGRTALAEDHFWVIDLYRAVLSRALKDLISFSDYSRSREAAKIGPEVRSWFLADAPNYLFSFTDVCRLLSLDRENIERVISPYMEAKNVHLADFTVFRETMTDADKAAFVESKVYRLGPCTIRDLLTSCRPLLYRYEIESLLAALIATGRVSVEVFSRGRGRRKKAVYKHSENKPRIRKIDQLSTGLSTAFGTASCRSF